MPWRYVKKLSAKGRFIGIDQDQDAIIAASERLGAYKQATIIRSNYCYMGPELAARGIHGVRRDPAGSWEYPLTSWTMKSEALPIRVDAPLDMRMDQRQTPDRIRHRQRL